MPRAHPLSIEGDGNGAVISNTTALRDSKRVNNHQAGDAWMESYSGAKLDQCPIRMIDKLRILTDGDAKLAYAALGLNGFIKGIEVSEIIQILIGLLTIMILLPRAIRSVKMMLKGKHENEDPDSADPFDTDIVRNRPDHDDPRGPKQKDS